jgi:hypothetical protein
MLSDPTLAYVSALPFRADAKRCICWLPLCGVYWADEIPDLPFFGRLPESSRMEVLRLFAIRYSIWANEPLSAEDQTYWDEARAQSPQYALFQRTKVTSDIVDLQQQIQEQYDAAFTELASQAKKVEISEKSPGLESFSVVFDVNQEVPAKPPWWKRFWRRSTPT